MGLGRGLQFGARLGQIAGAHPDQLRQLALGLGRSGILAHRLAPGGLGFVQPVLLVAYPAEQDIGMDIVHAQRDGAADGAFGFLLFAHAQGDGGQRKLRTRHPGAPA